MIPFFNILNHIDIAQVETSGIKSSAGELGAEHDGAGPPTHQRERLDRE